MKKYGPFRIKKDSAGRRRVTRNGERSSFAELEKYQRAKVEAGRKAYREAWKYPEPGDKKPRRVMSNQDKRLIVNYLRKNMTELHNKNYKRVAEELPPKKFKQAIEWSAGEPRKTIEVEVNSTDGNQRFDIRKHLENTDKVKGDYFIDGKKVTKAEFKKKLENIGEEYEKEFFAAGGKDYYSAIVEVEVDESGNTYYDTGNEVYSVIDKDKEE